MEKVSTPITADSLQCEVFTNGFEMLNSSLPGHLGIAVRCLLESGHTKDLRPYAAFNLEAPGRDALIRNEIRKAGWHIIDTEEKFDIVP